PGLRFASPGLRLLISFVLADARAQEPIVGFPDLRRLLVIEKRQERVALAARDFRYLMQERARKHHGASDRRLERTWAVFGEPHLSTLEVIVEIDRDGKAPVRRAFGRVVAMGTEMAAVLGRVARDNVAFHAGRLEIVNLEQLGNDPSFDPALE